MSHAWQWLYDVLGLSATRCLWCGGLIDGRKAELKLCPDCAEHFKIRSGGYCPSCGELYAGADESVYLCAACRRMSRLWSRLGFLGPYAGQLREAILTYKYQANPGYAKLMQTLAQCVYTARMSPEHPELLVPVPMSMPRLRRRGFNQSLEMARGLTAVSPAVLATLALKRCRNIPPQTGLSRRERRKNVKGAFAADPQRVQDRHVLLVDDVYTTGATLEACTRTLLKAGASRVDVLVLARAQDLH